ncbi:MULTISPECIES: hypothetical protein [unclassified Bacillus cereus group]|uniref:hypothetical protein n=1 Tax=unclassified Bacillus cereus group TaxID=2750818 RepID=UPI001F572987|nr:MULTISPECIES: hypothetical protein [unclassified Bacillus cereus group]
MKPKQEEIVIPILNLDKFAFSPPGPMGWALSEYEKALEEQDNIVLDEASVIENIMSIKEIELVEFPTVGLLDLEEQNMKTTQITSEVIEEINNPKSSSITEEIVNTINEEDIQNTIKLEEKQNSVVTELKKKKEEIEIIVPKQPLNGPWIAKIVKNKSEKE